MPKEEKKGKKSLMMSHNPLGADMHRPSGKLKAPKHVNDDDMYAEDNEDDSQVPEDLRQKIFNQARYQRDEMTNVQTSEFVMQNKDEEDNFEDDVSEDEDGDFEELVNVDGDYVEGVGLSVDEEAVVAKFLNINKMESRTLADIIMDKIKQKESTGGDSGDMDHDGDEDGDYYDSALPPKVVEVYSSVGKLLKHYSSGKLPKALKMLPHLRNWEDVLWITRPDEWSPIATFACTRIFASNLNAKMAQRFFNIVLLEKVRDDIRRNNKLNYHLYLALKKALFKPAAFYKGLLLPLALSNTCTLREATIIG